MCIKYKASMVRKKNYAQKDLSFGIICFKKYLVLLVQKNGLIQFIHTLMYSSWTCRNSNCCCNFLYFEYKSSKSAFFESTSCEDGDGTWISGASSTFIPISSILQTIKDLDGRILFLLMILQLSILVNKRNFVLGSIHEIYFLVTRYKYNSICVIFGFCRNFLSWFEPLKVKTMVNKNHRWKIAIWFETKIWKII